MWLVNLRCGRRLTALAELVANRSGAAEVSGVAGDDAVVGAKWVAERVECFLGVAPRFPGGGIVGVRTLKSPVVSGSNTAIHEFMHDARHLLGFPCH